MGRPFLKDFTRGKKNAAMDTRNWGRHFTQDNSNLRNIFSFVSQRSDNFFVDFCCEMFNEIKGSAVTETFNVLNTREIANSVFKFICKHRFGRGFKRQLNLETDTLWMVFFFFTTSKVHPDS